MSSGHIPKWSAETERDVSRRIVLGLILAGTLFTTGFYFFPLKLPIMDNVLDRLIYTLQWLMFSALTLPMGMVGVFGKRRGTVAANPIDGKFEHLLQTQKNILQNTLEQFVFHFVGLITLSTYLSPETMKAIPMLVIVFVTGRIIFKVGYERDPMQRTYGFAMTFLPTVFTYMYCTYCFVANGTVLNFDK